VLSFVAVTNRSERRMLRWPVLLGVLVVFVFLLVRLHPTNFFGLTEDDTIYFSSAKALAEGQGYILPSLPGSPPQHKYPILYPWLLSWVWRWKPSFPANLKDAVALTAIFGAGFIILIYFFLRGLRGLREAEALGLTAFCALTPHVLFYSGSVLTDIPFAALALAALMAGDGAMRPEARPTRAVAAGVLAGLAMLLRVLGFPVVAGIFLAGATRRSWRQAAIFCAGVLPFFVALTWNAAFTKPAAASLGAIHPNAAWQFEWAYYTNYLAFWKLSVPDSHVLWAMLASNANTLLLIPATFFLYPLVSAETILGRALWLLVTVGIAVGIVRQARRQEWKPIHWALPFYFAAMLVWNFSLADRLLLPFLPLFAAGLWLEGKHVFGMVRGTLAHGRARSEKILALLLGLGLAALAGAVAWNYAGGARSIMEARSRERAALLREKREAYVWLRRNSPADARVIAEEDASLYLYTGRQAARAVALSPAGVFEPARLEEQLARLCDAARAIGADYWVISDDDFSLTWPKAIPKARAREKQLEQVLPLVFRSGEGHVRIYSLGCLNHPDDPACRSADRILFPAARGGAAPERQ
jgi:4-amino-4-deoxy-L-arabinose transferase-like glycosyltransferase